MSDRAAQSPPPEEQSGRQLNDPPASGKGTDDASNKEQTNKSGLEVCIIRKLLWMALAATS